VRLVACAWARTVVSPTTPLSPSPHSTPPSPPVSLSLQEEAFYLAIASEHESDEQEAKRVDDIFVDLSKYDGPVPPSAPGAEAFGADGASARQDIPVTMDFVKQCIEHFRAQKLVHRKFVCQLLLQARTMFAALPSLLRISLPTLPDGSQGTVTVCGDTHGQFYDLLNIFEIGGFPSETNPYVFNGDFVDRGSFSFENVMTLILIKMACPAALHMTRGNHETKNMNKIYGFEGEVKAKYDELTMTVRVFVCARACLCE